MYFKTIELPLGLNQSQAETSLRKASIKKTMPLDFEFKAVDIGTDKLFYGLESKNSLTFTRLKTSFEVLLPKLIINLSKEQSVNYYKIRPSIVSIAIIGLLAFAIFIGLMNSLRGMFDLERFTPILVIAIIYMTLFFIELKITESKVIKALHRK